MRLARHDRTDGWPHTYLKRAVDVCRDKRVQETSFQAQALSRVASSLRYQTRHGSLCAMLPDLGVAISSPAYLRAPRFPEVIRVIKYFNSQPFIPRPKNNNKNNFSVYFYFIFIPIDRIFELVISEIRSQIIVDDFHKGNSSLSLRWSQPLFGLVVYRQNQITPSSDNMFELVASSPPEIDASRPCNWLVRRNCMHCVKQTATDSWGQYRAS